ncbi:MAG: hypothetical protein HQL76_05155 [Magnetococcales bacterium]|nr:hypothetical protein [Magnetococcales bacterium]
MSPKRDRSASSGAGPSVFRVEVIRDGPQGRWGFAPPSSLSWLFGADRQMAPVGYRAVTAFPIQA